MVFTISKRIFWPVLKLFIKRIDGIENLPDKPFIIVSNHESYIDPVIMLFMTAWYKNRKLCSFATNEKFTSFFWDLLFRHFGAIRINGSMPKALKTLKKGNCMGIWPEGARTYTGKMQKVTRTGLGVLALESGTPVVPIGVNTFYFWNRYRLLPRLKRNIVITIGKPLHFKGKTNKKNIKTVITKTMKEVTKLARISHT